MPIFNFLLSFFIEFGGIISFLYFAHFYDFYTAAYFLIFFSTLSLLFSWLRDRRLPVFAIASTSGVVFFGVLTLIFHNPYFIVLEYSVYNFSFALAVLWGYVNKKPMMKIFFPTMFSITERGWQEMSIRWGLLCLFLGFFSEYFWHFHGEQVWLEYRTLMLIFSTFFGLYQFRVSRKERLPDASSWGLKVFK